MVGMVLLPGLMCDAGLWQYMVEELSLYGPLTFGDLSLDGSQEEMAARVLLQAPKHFTLVGFSMGGFVAREIVRRAPDRVQRLILIATSSQQDSPQTRVFKEATAKSRLNSHGTFRGLGQKAIALSLSEKHAGNPHLQSHIHQMSLRMGKEAYCRQLLMARPGDTHLLSLIRCPTLVIAAAQDRMRSLQESRVLYAHLPHATLEIIDDSGHMLPLEQPGELVRCISRWLADAAA